MDKIEGKKVIFILDDFTFEIEKLFKEQIEKRNELPLNRSGILRKLYRAYIQEHLIVKD